MKSLGEAAARAARHREWHWCRHHNGFCDDPLWRLVAAELQMPVHQVVAFALRLEELANKADQRGYVGHFNPAEFGVALGMPSEDAARIFAILERPDVAWVIYDFVATFIDRNRDRDDDAAAARERKRRQRTREKALKELARQARRGEISEAERRRVEAELLLDERLAKKLSTAPPCHNVTDGGHNVTPRDIVTVTQEKSTGFSDGAEKKAAEAGPAAVAEAWLAEEGRTVVADRLQVDASKAQARLGRWRRDVDGDAAVIAEIVKAADKSDYVGARFHNLVVDQIRRWQQLQLGPPLPLLPPRPTGLKRSESA